MIQSPARSPARCRLLGFDIQNPTRYYHLGGSFLPGLRKRADSAKEWHGDPGAQPQSLAVTGRIRKRQPVSFPEIKTPGSQIANPRKKSGEKNRLNRRRDATLTKKSWRAHFKPNSITDLPARPRRRKQGRVGLIEPTPAIFDRSRRGMIALSGRRSATCDRDLSVADL